MAIDASVAVKWFRAEGGSDRAFALLESAAAGDVILAVPTHCMHEVLSVVRRDFGPSEIPGAWERMGMARLEVIPLTDAVVREAAVQCERLNCTFYDSLAPAVAALLGATLVSADAKAHSGYPGVELIG